MTIFKNTLGVELTVNWSCGNPFYYGYGFDIDVIEVPK